MTSWERSEGLLGAGDVRPPTRKGRLVEHIGERGPQAHGLSVIRGEGMCADDAAWASIADAAERALKLPGLTRRARLDVEEMAAACRAAAGQHPPLSEEEYVG